MLCDAICLQERETEGWRVVDEMTRQRKRRRERNGESFHFHGSNGGSLLGEGEYVVVVRQFVQSCRGGNCV